MCLEVTCPVRREFAWTTVLAQLQRAFEVPEFHAEPRERSERVDDQPTAVAGAVVALVGIRPCLGGAVDTEWLRHPFVIPPRMRLAHPCTGR